MKKDVVLSATVGEIMEILESNSGPVTKKIVQWAEAELFLLSLVRAMRRDPVDSNKFIITASSAVRAEALASYMERMEGRIDERICMILRDLIEMVDAEAEVSNLDTKDFVDIANRVRDKLRGKHAGLGPDNDNLN